MLILSLALWATASMGMQAFGFQSAPPFGVRQAGAAGQVPDPASGGEPRGITEITATREDEGVAILLKAARNFQYTAFRLPNPSRLVLDLPQMQRGILTAPLAINKGAVQSIQPLYFEEADVLRLEFLLDEEISYEIVKLEKNQLLITLRPSGKRLPEPADNGQIAAAPRGLDDEGTTRASEEEAPVLGNLRLQINRTGVSCDDMLSAAGKKISFDLERAELKKFLRTLSEIGGFNLVVSPEVEGTVTMRLADVPLKMALNKISTNNKLGRECFGNIMRIASKAALTPARDPLTDEEAAAQQARRNLCRQILARNNERVSFDFQQASLRNVLKFVSGIGGFNLVISPEVEGSVTMKLKDVPLDLALKALLRNNGLGQECSENIIRVASRSVLDEEMDARLLLEQSRMAAIPAKTTAPRKFDGFGKEVLALDFIPLELFQKIKETHPALYADLEHYARLFNEKSELKKMDRESYSSMVKFYKGLIDNANALKTEILKTPLETDFQSLKLVGIIWGGQEPIALVETEDNRGHTVRAGTLMGTNFGVVQSIEPEKITIVENSRDFLGNIVSETLAIELVKETQELQGGS